MKPTEPRCIVPKPTIRRHTKINKKTGEDDGLKFSRAAFVSDILFSEDGYGLIPKVFTKSTKNLSDDQKIPSTSAKDHLPYFADIPFVAAYMDYTRLQKLRGTYVGTPATEEWEEEAEDGTLTLHHAEPATGFWKYIHNGRIHPSFLLHRTVTGRTDCLHGSTEITVLDQRGTVPIRGIRAGDWVWTFDSYLDLSPAQVEWAGPTGRSERMIEITIRTQGRREIRTIRCTYDHAFRLRDGTYVPACDLTSGHRLLAVERDVNHAGYRRIYHTGRREAVLEHRLVVGLSDPRSHVHHLNETKQDNRPENLLVVSPQNHARFHPRTAEQIERARHTWEMRYGHMRGQFTGSPGPRLIFDPDWAEEALRSAGGNPTVFRDVYGHDYTAAMAALDRAGVNWRSIRSEYNARGQLIADLLPLARACTRIKDAAAILGVNFYRARELLEDDHNHEVLNVRYLEGQEVVYGLLIEGSANFIADGVCVGDLHSPASADEPRRARLRLPVEQGPLVDRPRVRHRTRPAASGEVRRRRLYTGT